MLLIAGNIGGAALAWHTARGLWAGSYFWSLVGVLCLGCAAALSIAPAFIRDEHTPPDGCGVL